MSESFDPTSFTTDEMATHLNVKREEAYGFLNYLRARGYVNDTGAVRKKDGAKGKGATIFAFSETMPEGIREHLVKGTKG